MNTQELAQRLFEEGCNPTAYAIGARGGASDAYCLTFNVAQWEVYYTERGHDEPPIFVSGSEAQACDFFFRHIMAMRHEHCVGSFRSEQNATALRQRLQELGLVTRQDRIPYGGPNDPRFRVFVTGKAIFTASAVLGDVPVRDPGE